MLITGTSDIIQFKLGSTATTELPFTVDYNNYTSTGVSLLTNNGTSNDTIAVDLVPSPASGQQNELRYCSIYNADSTSETVIIQVFDGVNTRVVFRCTLGVGDMLQYQLEKGWEVIDNNGNKKTNSVQVFNNNVCANALWRPAGVGGTLAFVTQNWYYIYLGRAEKSYSSIDVQYNLVSAAVGTITYSQLAIYSPAPKPFDGTAAVIGRRLGVVDTILTGSTGVRKTNIPVSTINTGDMLYAVFSHQYGTTQPTIRSQAYADVLANYVQGLALTAVGSGRPSLVPTGPYVTGYGTALIWLYWQGN